MSFIAARNFQSFEGRKQFFDNHRLPPNLYPNPKPGRLKFPKVKPPRFPFHHTLVQLPVQNRLMRLLIFNSEIGSGIYVEALVSIWNRQVLNNLWPVPQCRLLFANMRECATPISIKGIPCGVRVGRSCRYLLRTLLSSNSKRVWYINIGMGSYTDLYSRNGHLLWNPKPKILYLHLHFIIVIDSLDKNCFSPTPLMHKVYASHQAPLNGVGSGFCLSVRLPTAGNTGTQDILFGTWKCRIKGYSGDRMSP